MDAPKLLSTKTIDEAVEEALRKIEYERTGKQHGLLCSYKQINRMMLKYWRFGQVTMIAGMSGSGKSAILNMLENDFSDLKRFDEHNNNIAVNKDFLGEVLVLAFKYEMGASDEVLRNLSGRTGKSYGYLLSAEYDRADKQYNTVSDFEYEEFKMSLEGLKGRPIIYIEVAGNLIQLYNLVKHYAETQPHKKLVVTIDHTMLSVKLNEKDDLELMSATAQCCVRLRKNFNAMVIPLNQLNGEIEKPMRKENPNFHYPTKIDIHCGNQIFWACDNVIVFHRPEKLDLTTYGKLKLPTTGLIHGICLKSRFAVTGDTWYKEEFSKGKIREISLKDEFPKLFTNQIK